MTGTRHWPRPAPIRLTSYSFCDLHLFIDTNVYLSFFHFAKDDLEELRKLTPLISRNEVQLYLPNQVIAEFWRNRDNRIADLLKRVRESEPRISYPRPFHDFVEHVELRALGFQVETLHTSMMRKAEEAAKARTFPADTVIQELFGRATVISVNEDHIARARSRRELGGPPGKRDSLGDAVNWEALFAAVPDGEDLNFVSEDSDWLSPLGAEAFNSYLLSEWQEAKGGKIVYYPLLSLFFKQHYPSIRLAADAEAELLVRDLTNSGSFSETHAMVASLERLSDLTPAQVKAIAAAVVNNGQIRRIIHDADVERFIRRLIDTRGSDMAEANRQAVEQLLSEPEETVFWDIALPGSQE